VQLGTKNNNNIFLLCRVAARAQMASCPRAALRERQDDDDDDMISLSLSLISTAAADGHSGQMLCSLYTIPTIICFLGFNIVSNEVHQE